MRPWFVSFLVVALGLMLLAIPTRAGVERAAGTPLPSSLTLLDRYDLSISPRGITFKDGIVYVSSNSGFVGVDVSNPQSMARVLSVTATPRGRHDLMEVVGDRMVLQGERTVDLYDVSAPTSPTLHSRVDPTMTYGLVEAVVYRNDRLYLNQRSCNRACNYRLSVFDVSTPGSPQLVGEVGPSLCGDWGPGLALDTTGQYALIPATGGLCVVDLQTLTMLPPGSAGLTAAASIAVTNNLPYLGGTIIIPRVGQVVDIGMISETQALHDMGPVGRLYLSGGLLVSERRDDTDRRQITLYEPTPTGPTRPRLDFVPPQMEFDAIEEGVAIDGSRLYALESDGGWWLAIYDLDRSRFPAPRHLPLFPGP